MIADRTCACGIVFAPACAHHKSCRLCRARYEETAGRRWRPGAYGALGFGDGPLVERETAAEDVLWSEINEVYWRAVAVIAEERAMIAEAARAGRQERLRRMLRM